ncbi:MAG: hypothetical protein RIQ56_925 [Candidatus Parcubacteria bacterium]
MKGDKTRAQKLWDNLVNTDAFNRYLMTARLNLDIHVAGFSSYDEILKWYMATEKSAMLKEVSDFLGKQKLPNNRWWQQKALEYFFSDGEIPFFAKLEPWVQPFIENTQTEASTFGSISDLRIYEGASAPEVKDFINKNWPSVRAPARMGIGLRIRADDFSERNAAVHEMMTLPRKELLKRYPHPDAKPSKEQLVAWRLRKRWTLSADNVHQIYHRKKKRTR